MHASTQHNKAELVLARANELLADADVHLEKSQQEYDTMQATIEAREKENEAAQQEFNNDISAELDKVTKAADEYIESFDEQKEV